MTTLSPKKPSNLLSGSTEAIEARRRVILQALMSEDKQREKAKDIIRQSYPKLAELVADPLEEDAVPTPGRSVFNYFRQIGT